MSSGMRLAGKLHRHIVQLQFSEATAVRQLDAAQKKLTRLEAQLLRTEQSMDEKDRTIYHNSLEARNKVHHLKRTVQVFTPFKYSHYSCINTVQVFSSVAFLLFVFLPVVVAALRSRCGHYVFAL